jgi:hypothetical protein
VPFVGIRTPLPLRLFTVEPARLIRRVPTLPALALLLWWFSLAEAVERPGGARPKLLMERCRFSVDAVVVAAVTPYLVVFTATERLRSRCRSVVVVVVRGTGAVGSSETPNKSARSFGCGDAAAPALASGSRLSTRSGVPVRFGGLLIDDDDEEEGAEGAGVEEA